MDEAVVTSIITINYFWRFYYETFSSFIRNSSARACATKEKIRTMFLSGMTGMRLNLSHSNLDDCKDWLQQYYEVSERLHIVPELLVDLQGPELRIGTLDIPLSLSENDLIFLVSEKSFDKRKENSAIFSRIIAGEDELSIIPCPDILFSYFDEGQEVKLNDGKIVLELSAPLEEDIFCAKVKKGGELTSRKSIAIKDVTVPLPVLTETDKQNLKLLRKYHVTGVMLPFVRNADDLITLRKELCADGMDYIRIFAKIESLEGVENLPSLLPFCDEIVIARGDLGNAIPLPKLPAIQKRIAMTCLRAKKPFMVVTQMLASMEQNPVPTRAEVTDIFQAVLDGASSLMLTGETAVGAYPEEAIKILAQTSEEALRFKIAKF